MARAVHTTSRGNFSLVFPLRLAASILTALWTVAKPPLPFNKQTAASKNVFSDHKNLLAVLLNDTQNQQCNKLFVKNNSSNYKEHDSHYRSLGPSKGQSIHQCSLLDRALPCTCTICMHATHISKSNNPGNQSRYVL